jgi:hypothetical protein
MTLRVHPHATEAVTDGRFCKSTHSLKICFLFFSYLVALHLPFALRTLSVNAGFGAARKGGYRTTGILLSDNGVGFSIGFLLISIAWPAHRHLAPHQALHESVAMGALQIQQRLHARATPANRARRIAK